MSMDGDEGNKCNGNGKWRQDGGECGFFVGAFFFF